jgi:hypothetical protein
MQTERQRKQNLTGQIMPNKARPKILPEYFSSRANDCVQAWQAMKFLYYQQITKAQNKVDVGAPHSHTRSPAFIFENCCPKTEQKFCYTLSE